MQSWPWRTMVFAGMAIAFVYAATRSDPELSSLGHAAPAELVQRLASSREPVRRAAASQLVSRGLLAVPALLDTIPDADPEQLEEIFFVLEDLYLSADDAVYDEIGDVLEKLRHDDRSDIRGNAERLLQINSSRRHLRALTRIESAGGKIRTTSANRRQDVSVPDLILLDAEWTGGAAEFKALRHLLPHLTSLHVSADSPLSDDDVASLRKMLPCVVIRREQEPCLGIECYRYGNVVEVIRVAPGSPADRFGLRRFDCIVELDGTPAGSVAEFFQRLRGHKPGDQIALEVVRHNQSLSLTLELGDDFATGRCRCQPDSPGDVEENAEPQYSPRGRLLHPTDRFLGPSSNISVNFEQ
jgi:hypothetical protein